MGLSQDRRASDLNVTRTKVRFLGRLLKELNKSEAGSFWDFLVPKKYDLVKTTVRELGLISPQMSIQVSNYVKKLCTIKIGMSIVNEDDISQKHAENFLRLYENSWSAEINAPIIKHQKLMQLNKTQETPLDTDIAKLVDFMDKEIVRLIEQAKIADNCSRLSKVLLTKLIIFNRPEAQA
ncbi:hypothetical protein EB796_006699 [Bugula neritina]|uniref:Uncharacterized protein n=1 Tax=Bugula neritina TaxID=10212 RepID=A0A7J7K8M3_BUGNE|nr:hypothetical protein EB796_006699 [Bugula neritina]